MRAECAFGRGALLVDLLDPVGRKSALYGVWPGVEVFLDILDNVCVECVGVCVKERGKGSKDAFCWSFLEEIPEVGEEGIGRVGHGLAALSDV